MRNALNLGLSSSDLESLIERTIPVPEEVPLGARRHSLANGNYYIVIHACQPGRAPKTPVAKPLYRRLKAQVYKILRYCTYEDYGKRENNHKRQCMSLASF